MTQSELHRAVSRSTGEDPATIAARGFNLVDEDSPVSEDDLEALSVDWEQLVVERNTSVLPCRELAAMA